MTQVVLDTTRTITLEERLARGADLLFDMELRGDTGDEYVRWLSRWLELLAQYEATAA
jgi:hypothetical protein